MAVDVLGETGGSTQVYPLDPLEVSEKLIVLCGHGGGEDCQSPILLPGLKLSPPRSGSHISYAVG